MNHLLVIEALELTNDEYPVLKLTDKSEQYKNQTVSMKLAKEREKTQTAPKKQTKQISTEADPELFARLRALRFQIAKKEKVPPYIIFSDKTLIDMSAKAPKNKEEMLNVSGVGEVKFQRYGQAFLEVIVQE